MQSDGRGLTVAEAYANQIAYCRNNDAPITARVLEGIAALLDLRESGKFIETIRNWPGEPLVDAVPLRSTGGFHALHISGRAPELAALYSGSPANDTAVLASAARLHEAFLLPWLDGPPQTNEAGRSWGFVAAMLWLAAKGLPAQFECLEIGSSAGVNLMMDRYFYDLCGVRVGPEKSPDMAFVPAWRGPPPPDVPIRIASLRGCDVAPLDLTDLVEALRLKAYVWPEHTVRFKRIDAAVRAARCRKPELVRMDAADFVEAQLSLPQKPGTTRVLMHSIVWQYLPADQQARINTAMAAAGAKADGKRALAWIALEADRTLLNHGLRVRCWPGEKDGNLLAAAHAHGAWVDWLGAT